MTESAPAISQRSVGGFLWTAGGFGAQALAQLAVLALLARLLTAFEFGVVSAALVVIGLGGVITDAIVGPALTQRINLTEHHIRSAFSLSIYIGTAATVVLWIGADWVASLFSLPGLAVVVQALAALFIIEAFSAVPIALMQRNLQFRRLATTETLSFVLGYAGVGSFLAIQGAGVWALVLAQLAYSSMRSVLLVYACPHVKSLRVDGDAAKDILQFGSGHSLAKLFNYGALQGDYFVIGRWMSAAALGIYGRAYQLAMRPAVMLGQALDKVMFPVLASLQQDLDRLRRAYRRLVSLNAAISLPASAVAVVLGPELVRTVLGSGWEQAILPFQVLAAGVVFRTGYKTSDSLAKATGKVFSRAWRQALYAALVLLGAMIGTRWGLGGVAGMILVAIMVNYLLMAALSLAVLDMSWTAFASAHLRGIVLAAGTIAVVLPVANWLRAADMGTARVLIGALGAIGLALAVAGRLAPARVFGPELISIFDRLKHQLQRGSR